MTVSLNDADNPRYWECWADFWSTLLPPLRDAWRRANDPDGDSKAEALEAEVELYRWMAADLRGEHPPWYVAAPRDMFWDGRPWGSVVAPWGDNPVTIR